VTIWQAWCARHSVRFINHFPIFVKEGTTDERMAILSRYYINGDYHWNEAGHRAVADAFLAAYTGDHAIE
jgi:hypothetical protein